MKNRGTIWSCNFIFHNTTFKQTLPILRSPNTSYGYGYNTLQLYKYAEFLKFRIRYSQNMLTQFLTIFVGTCETHKVCSPSRIMNIFFFFIHKTQEIKPLTTYLRNPNSLFHCWWAEFYFKKKINIKRDYVFFLWAYLIGCCRLILFYNKYIFFIKVSFEKKKENFDLP